MKKVKALVFTGYGLNCDYETDFSLKQAGAVSHRIHINEVIEENHKTRGAFLDQYHIMVLGGGFSWGDDHGAGVLIASKLKHHMGRELKRFIDKGKLIIGICNGFQALVNMGLLPGFDSNYNERRIALVANDRGNFIDIWTTLRINESSPSVFTKGMSVIDLPVRHGEGKFYASKEDIERLVKGNQIVMQYATRDKSLANGRYPANPNGSLEDIAAICDPTGHILGMMPHPEAFNHYTNHPEWSIKKSRQKERIQEEPVEEGNGIMIFSNAVSYVKEHLLQA